MFGEAQIVIKRTKVGYETLELHNSLGYVDYINEIVNRQRLLLLSALSPSSLA
jgi:hypothetical protein